MHEKQTIVTDDRGLRHTAQLGGVCGVIRCSLLLSLSDVIGISLQY